MVHGQKCLESREDEVKSVKREPSDTAMGWPTGFEPTRIVGEGALYNVT